MAEFVTCKQIVKAYKVANHEVVALRGIDFEMARGEMVAIIGPSGAGKSSLLNLLGGLDSPTAGQLLVNDIDLLELKGKSLADYRLRQVGFIWQQVERNLFANKTALQNVILPMMVAGEGLSSRRARAHELLEAVGIADRANHPPSALSGGQQQRVAIAVALANQPNLLLADEPTGALDGVTAVQVMELLNDLRERFQLTVLMVTHDMKIASFADRVLTLRDGALGQDLSEAASAGPTLDDEGRIQLPSRVRSHLTAVDRIAVEIRPEGILLRPEIDETNDHDHLLQMMLPEDAQPEQRRSGLGKVLRIFGRR
jgi:ABC-type lipoprotein export system ATPase subunit